MVRAVVHAIWMLMDEGPLPFQVSTTTMVLFLAFGGFIAVAILKHLFPVSK